MSQRPARWRVTPPIEVSTGPNYIAHTQAEDPPDPLHTACNLMAPVCAGVTLSDTALDQLAARNRRQSSVHGPRHHRYRSLADLMPHKSTRRICEGRPNFSRPQANWFACGTAATDGWQVHFTTDWSWLMA